MQQHCIAGDKYASREFLRLVEHSAAKLLEFMQADIINQRLYGLGVLSPICISFDSVSIGDSLYARNETFQVIVVTVLDLSPGVPLLATHFLQCPSVGLSHDGDNQAACVLKALEDHAGQFNKRSLRRRVLTLIAGDGAVARGGQSMRHVGTEACNKLAKFLSLIILNPFCLTQTLISIHFYFFWFLPVILCRWLAVVFSFVISNGPGSGWFTQMLSKNWLNGSAFIGAKQHFEKHCTSICISDFLDW